MNINIKFSHRYLFYIFLFLFLNLSLYSYAFFNEVLMVFSVVIGLFLIFYLFLSRGISIYSKKSKNLYFYFLILFTILMPIGVYNSIFNLYFYMASMVGITLAFQLSKFAETTLFFLKWTLVLAQFFILYYIASNISVNPYPLEDILDGAGSSNVVTSFLIVVQSVYTANLFYLKNKFSWITIVITFLICFLGYGRGSIIAAFGLISIAFLFVFFDFLADGLRNRMNFVFFVFFVFLFFCFFVFFMDDIFNFFINNTKLGNGLVDDARRSMISDYFANMNGFSLLFGLEYKGTVIDYYYGGNPHNSFIRGHHIFGVFYLMLIFFVIFYALISQVNSRNALFLFFILMVVNFRAFSEPIIFPTILDFYYFLIIFFSLESGKESKNL